LINGAAPWAYTEAGRVHKKPHGASPVPGVVDPVDVTAGERHSCAVEASGRVLCWGNNMAGQLGLGNLDSGQLTPVAVPGIDDAIAVAAAELVTCVLHATGTISCWGENSYGELGDGTTEDRTLPGAVEGIDGAIDLAVGHFHSCAPRSSGAISCWGLRGYGVFGDATAGWMPTPVSTLRP